MLKEIFFQPDAISNTLKGRVTEDQIIVNEWCIARGGHTRTGLEDNIKLDRYTLAPSNAELVKKVVQICEKYERPVASTHEAREILNLNT